MNLSLWSFEVLQLAELERILIADLALVALPDQARINRVRHPARIFERIVDREQNAISTDDVDSALQRPCSEVARSRDPEVAAHVLLKRFLRLALEWVHLEVVLHAPGPNIDSEHLPQHLNVRRGLFPRERSAELRYLPIFPHFQEASPHCRVDLRGCQGIVIIRAIVVGKFLIFWVLPLFDKFAGGFIGNKYAGDASEFLVNISDIS